MLHQFLKANYIDSEAALTCHEFGQIQRKSVGVVKFKCNFAGYLTRNTCFRHFDVELHRPIKNRESFIESFVKRFFFAVDCLLDLFLLCADFREDITHVCCDNIDEFEEEWFVKTQRAAIANRAPQNAARYITAAFV